MAQLPLALRLKPYASLASFVRGRNAAAVEHVRAVAAGLRHESVWLGGARSTGKTHLLAAGCRAAGEAGFRSMYLPLDPAGDPDALRALDDVDLLALDEVHAVAGDRSWETALFAVLNERLSRGGLLLAADHVPRDCGFALADLASRAAAASTYRLLPLEDDALRQAVVRQASMRGLKLDDAAAAYLIQRLSRDLGELVDWLDRIDRYSLARQRKITIPLLRQVIGADAAE